MGKHGSLLFALSQTAVTAYLKSKQLLLFVFTLYNNCPGQIDKNPFSLYHKPGEWRETCSFGGDSINLMDRLTIPGHGAWYPLPTLVRAVSPGKLDTQRIWSGQSRTNWWSIPRAVDVWASLLKRWPLVSDLYTGSTVKQYRCRTIKLTICSETNF